MPTKLLYPLVAILGSAVAVLQIVTYKHSPLRDLLNMTSPDDMRLIIMQLIQVVLLVVLVIIAIIVSRKRKR